MNELIMSHNLGVKLSALILQIPSFVTDFFLNFGFAEVTRHSEMKRKSRFSFAFLSFFRNFAEKSAKLLRLGKKRNEFLLFCSQLFVTLQPD